MASPERRERRGRQPSTWLRGICRYAGGELLEKLLEELDEQTNPDTIDIRWPDAEDIDDRPGLWLVRGNEIRQARQSGIHLEQLDVIKSAARIAPTLKLPLLVSSAAYAYNSTNEGEYFGNVAPALPLDFDQIQNERAQLWRSMHPTYPYRFIEPDVTLFFAHEDATEQDIADARGIVQDAISAGLAFELRPAEEVRARPQIRPAA